MQKQKILMVNLGFLPESVGGSEFYTYNLSKSLICKSFDVTVLTASEDVTLERYKVVRTEFEGIKVIKITNPPLYARSFMDFFLDPNIANLFRGILDEEKPDLIHFQHTAYLSGNLPEIAHQMNIPSVFTLHDYWYICYRSHLLRPGCGICPGPSEGVHCATCHDESVPNPTAVAKFPLVIRLMNFPLTKSLIVNAIHRIPQSLISRVRDLLFMKPITSGNVVFSTSTLPVLENNFRYDFFKRQFTFPEFVLSPSHHLKKRYENEGYREIKVLPLGFHQTDKLEKLPLNGKLKIAYIGNIERDKGAAVLLQELSKLEELDRIEIHIHGKVKDPIYFSEVKRQAQAYPQGVVTLHGEYRSDKDLKNIFAEIHLAVFPSLWEENYPLVIREALLHGKPVIGSKLGGVPEVVEDDVNGYVFDPFKEGDLLDRINHILQNPEALETITEGARNTKIEGMEAHVSKIADIYHRAIKS